MVAEKPLTKAEIEAMVQRAAACGARQALAAVGLHDERAAADVRELRGVLEAWRSAKSTALTTAVKIITTAFLAAIVAGVGWTWTQKQ
jgi:2-iminoacetate synthase ThiH